MAIEYGIKQFLKDKRPVVLACLREEYHICEEDAITCYKEGVEKLRKKIREHELDGDNMQRSLTETLMGCCRECVKPSMLQDMSFLRYKKGLVVNVLRKFYHLSDADAEDCFQEGSLAVWQQLKSGQLVEGDMTCSLTTYLVRCCCNHATHKLRHDAIVSEIETHEFEIDENGELVHDVAVEEERDEIKESMMRMMQAVVEKMQTPCREILWGSYYEKVPQPVLAEILKYRNVETLRATKVRCMKKLKDMVYSLTNVHQ